MLPSSSDLARQMGTPAKLFDYLSVGLPVAANNVGGWSSIIEKNKVGILTSDDPKQFADDIVDLLRSKDRLSQYSRNGLELVRSKYNWANSAKELIKVYGSIP